MQHPVSMSLNMKIESDATIKPMDDRKKVYFEIIAHGGLGLSKSQIKQKARNLPVVLTRFGHTLFTGLGPHGHQTAHDGRY